MGGNSLCCHNFEALRTSRFLLIHATPSKHLETALCLGFRPFHGRNSQEEAFQTETLYLATVRQHRYIAVDNSCQMVTWTHLKNLNFAISQVSFLNSPPALYFFCVTLVIASSAQLTLARDSRIILQSPKFRQDSGKEYFNGKWFGYFLLRASWISKLKW